MALLVYCNTADAARVLSRSSALTPLASFKSGERSKMEFGVGRVDHWNEELDEAEEEALALDGDGGGTKDQADDEPL